MACFFLSIFFFFTHPPTTEIYTLSLHDALPICLWRRILGTKRPLLMSQRGEHDADNIALDHSCLASLERSEEHTSELQSHSDLVCRLLLEKKKNREQ